MSNMILIELIPFDEDNMWKAYERSGYRNREIAGSTIASAVRNFYDAYPGLVYFVADLDPAPVSSDKFSSIMTGPQLQAFLDDFRVRVVPRTGAIVTTTLTAPEALDFLSRYPDARRLAFSYGDRPFYVLVRDQARSWRSVGAGESPLSKSERARPRS
jgi:hypothetical protein